MYISVEGVRLRKSPLRPHSNSTEEAGQNLQDSDDPIFDSQEYVNSHLVPAEFLPHLEHVEVERAEAVAVHDEKRPAKGRAKGIIDLKRKRAVLATDLIGSKGRAIEMMVCSASLHHSLTDHGDAYSPSGGPNVAPTLRVLSSRAGHVSVLYAERMQIRSYTLEGMYRPTARWN
jgi:hypothetical protein